MRKKLLAALLTGALAVSSLAGCGSESESSTSTGNSTDSTDSAESGETTNSADQADSDDEIPTLKVSFPTGNIRVAINIIALEKGYFEEEGVNVEPVNISGQDALVAINGDSDQLDILTAGFVADLQAIGSGYNLVIIAGTAVEGGAIIAKSGNASEYQDEDTVIDIEALKTAKLGLARNEAAWVITRQYLLDNGVTEEEIAAIEDEENGNVSYFEDSTAIAQAVQKGEIDIGFLPMEYALLYGDAYELEVVSATGDLEENYVCCREVTSSARLEEKYDAFVAYETARIRAFEYYTQGVEDETIRAEVVGIVADYSGKESDYVETYLYGGVTKYATDPNTNGVISYVEAAANSGLLSGSGVDFLEYDITQNVDSSAYGEAINALVEREPDNEFYQELLEQFETDN